MSATPPPTDDAAPSATLAERVAAEHWLTAHRHTHCVGCGWVPDREAEDSAVAARRHVAEVTEREVLAALTVSDVGRQVLRDAAAALPAIGNPPARAVYTDWLMHRANSLPERSA